MSNHDQAQQPAQDLLAEVEHLRQRLTRLQQENDDLRLSLLTTSEHGDLIESELHATNQKLKAEVAERKLAQATLQEILETISRDKADLELILKATTEHGDTVEYQLYTQAVETVRQSEELFRAISESTSILMILTQQDDGTIAYANRASSDHLGISNADLIGQRLSHFFENSGDYDQFQASFARDGYVQNYETQIRREDGTLLWVSASAFPLTLAGKSTALTTLYDISDRKKAESILKNSEAQLRQQAEELEIRVTQRTQELRQAEEKYRSIFENAAEGIFQASPEGVYLSANPALAKMLGYASVEELLNSITDIGRQIYVQPSRRSELIAYLRRFDSVTGFESQIYSKNGSLLWVSENVRAVYDQAGNLLHYEGSMRDITELKSTEAELRQQRLRAERLLLNVLPQPIAERLKRGEKNIADSFAEVTVLFADIVDFTHLAATNPPDTLLDLLNQVFSAFDALADQSGLEKIKTIGDAYMLVGGLPKPRPDHVSAIADMALNMIQATNAIETPNGYPLQIRVGIHTGPVIAGVIGRRKFIYDLWGDTVNVASRMESQGEPGKIQVTAEIFNRLHRRYAFQERGYIDVKGKGEMMTYWLTGHYYEFQEN